MVAVDVGTRRTLPRHLRQGWQARLYRLGERTMGNGWFCGHGTCGVELTSGNPGDHEKENPLIQRSFEST